MLRAKAFACILAGGDGGNILRLALLVMMVQGRPLSVVVQGGMVQVDKLHGVAKLAWWLLQL
ncbi:hypothetical protein C2845_PM12G14730 [Panicum miliaceum]|uniref:Uncharacterized protein n=1 Tax=Panicum miliaceum TaxID=4540 RepID=A0A3L6QFV5_PANMI|nr:hypothetical protein C2845_PM12G14730 [Panicum miliaceum]